MRVLAFVLLLVAPATAEIIAYPGRNISANGTYLFGPGRSGNPSFQLDYIGAGTGTVTFTCKLNDLAPDVTFDPAVPSCSADCLRTALPLCHTYVLTMSSCSGCNVNVYMTERTH